MCIRDRYDPRLREVPMAVGGSEENRHGIVLAKNELAKQFGIKTAETLWQARQKCPELVVVPPHYERYYEVSRAVRAIYARYTDRIEPFGIDECWLDMTGSTLLFGSCLLYTSTAVIDLKDNAAADPIAFRLY